MPLTIYKSATYALYSIFMIGYIIDIVLYFYEKSIVNTDFARLSLAFLVLLTFVLVKRDRTYFTSALFLRSLVGLSALLGIVDVILIRG
jgi:hypothetical protein